MLAITDYLELRPFAEPLVSRANGDFWVHLVEPSRGRTLCGLAVRVRPPEKSFREAGCTDCLTSAVEAGHVAAREGERAWISLLRL